MFAILTELPTVQVRISDTNIHNRLKDNIQIIDITYFWYVTPCGLKYLYQLFEKPFYAQLKFIPPAVTST